MSTPGFRDTDTPGPDEFLFLPLGGTGEIGMNLNLYGHDEKWLMVDCGITFGDERTPGIDVIMPDPAFIEERIEDLCGLVLTHAHEDHLGAVQYLWPKLKCPIYATPFTAAVLRRKLSEVDFGRKVQIIEVPMSGTFDVGPFNIELITLTHSIPEPNALAIRTSAGVVLHTGDWKLDPDPQVGPTTDEARLIAIGEEGVMAMVCDSTNSLNSGRSGSEGDVRKNLADVVRDCQGGVAIACFASNVARLESAAKAAIACGRQPALAGRSLWRMNECARECGYLQDLPPFLNDEAASRLPAEKVLWICTGSQGEPRAALARIARGDHQNIKLGQGDTVIFSSREIPGNEVSIGELQNSLTELGCTIITANDAEIHASGHPNRDELADMYSWIRPQVAVPVHGEHRHLLAHARLAESCQVPHGIVAQNGMLMSLTNNGAEVIDQVYSGRLAVDGDRLIPMDHGSIRQRKRLAQNGAAVVSIALDKSGRLADEAQLTLAGLLDSDGPEWDDLLDLAEETVENLSKAQLKDDDQVVEAVRIAIRRKLQVMTRRRPQVDVHLLRV
ncbi:MAG TPA: MBL fold hydrolase [Rhodospirillaceae bacterium]|nr:MBL fold hydrolase [Rhodospirillaceae bacterium]MAX61294.1 MBL fold hydrolase [Rhodospirillaceae bacterium]MBB56038.1 MBL fold hydrolase [Rhodospirillaceae bacterium]HAE01900.1 MBL fold hydrolase [Rhodospirillaceae bacterium]HBM12804.1 MBL fold hydrolase [Rhodospirillaceae bacterium]|tara:strand:+ start:16021 stop:17697 length:1677 start_codon:yes stop_codon:yes gene_type:complete